jgi:PAS domain S-box-containing protein
MDATRSPSRVTGRSFLRGEDPLSSDTPVLLGLAGFDGKLKFLNPAWERALGYPPHDLLERPLRELVPPHERAAAAHAVDRLLAGDDGFDAAEFGLRCRDGTYKWFLWHRRFDPEHQAIFIAGYDITEEKSREIASMLRSYAASKGMPAPD